MDLKFLVNTDKDDQESSARRLSRQNSKASLSALSTDAASQFSPTGVLSPRSAQSNYFQSPISPPAPHPHSAQRPHFVNLDSDDKQDIFLIKDERKRSHRSTPTRSPLSVQKPPPKPLRKSGPIPIWAQHYKGTRPVVKRESQPPRDQPEPVVKTEPANTEQWEPAFTNIYPHDYITRRITDFLYGNVVQGAGLELPSGSIEIEAKIGHIIDRGKNDRIDFRGISGEIVIEGGHDIAFKSMMTVQQHHMFNEHLNEAVKQSMSTAPKPRNPIKYEHKRERDSFFKLPNDTLSTLAPSALRYVNKAMPPRVRITTDQKTGQITAQIIKIRIADLHIHCPQNPFDWRVSVNAELPWPGDAQQLVASNGPQHNGDYAQDRNKDRMSYQHQVCRIDLTQVKPTSTQQVGAEAATHELEVELDGAYVQEQGLLAGQGRPNRYEDVVRTFVDNVRTLVRAW